MQKHFYFDGKQIKNYLIGFASLFSEIPFKDRVGKIKTVPIHYGSPSDVVSHLENNVDNEATKNRNRLKDISVPLFSFRMTGIERQPEKRRAAHDSVTVDLRPLGYNMGYVTMKPAPYKFTMELICWASSDYQAFEISEQIIPYFNSPQQVMIEPLPRSSVSTTEVFLDTIEIDTDPESQKYSALITMTFSLTGYLLTQPRLWSTNLQFELSMLDEKNGKLNIDDTDYSVGHEIREMNTTPTKLPSEDRFADIGGFIRNTPDILWKYGEKLDWYNILLEKGSINENGEIIDSTEFTVSYKGTPKTFYPETINFITDEIDDVRYIMQNDMLIDYMTDFSLEGELKLLNSIVNDDTETIYVYLKLLDNNLSTKDFDHPAFEVLNSQKLSLFGTARVDIDDILKRLKTYLSGIEYLKVFRDRFLLRRDTPNDSSVFIYENEVSYDNLPISLHSLIPSTFITDNELLSDLSFTSKIDRNNNIVIRMEPNTTGSLILQTDTVPSVITFTSNETGRIFIDPSDYPLNESFGMVIKVPDKKIKVYGVVVTDLTVEIDINNFDYRIFGMEALYNIGKNSNGQVVAFELDDNIFNMYDSSDVLDIKFYNINKYVISSLSYNDIQLGSHDKTEMMGIIENKFGIDYVTLVNNANMLKQFLMKSIEYIDITQVENGFTQEELTNGHRVIVNPLINNDTTTDEYLGLSQTLNKDLDGKLIYDVNHDGFINKKDLEILDATVENIDDYDHELVHGVWYKRFNPDNLSEADIENVLISVKDMMYIIEKGSYVEIFDWIFLFDRGLVTAQYGLYPVEDTKKYDEIKSLGYNIAELEAKLLYLQVFQNIIRIIMLNNRKYIDYRVSNLNEKSKKLMFGEIGVNIDKIVIGKFLELYMKTLNNTERLDKEYKIRDILTETNTTWGEYSEYIFEFDLLLEDIIENSTLIPDSLDTIVTYFDTLLPDIKTKIENKYLNN